MTKEIRSNRSCVDETLNRTNEKVKSFTAQLPTADVENEKGLHLKERRMERKTNLENSKEKTEKLTQEAKSNKSY